MIEQQRLEQLLNVATVLVVASVGVASVTLILRIASRNEAPAPTTSVRASKTPREPLDLAAVLRLSPFGVANASPVAAGAGDGLVLRGVLLARPQSASSALIGGSDGKVQDVVIGQALSDGSVLEAVTADTATLRTGAGARVLVLRKSGAGGGTGVAAILAGMPPGSTAPTSAPSFSGSATTLPAPPPPPPPPSDMATPAPAAPGAPVR